MTIGPRQNLAKAKFKNLTMDERPIEHKPSTELLGVADQTYFILRIKWLAYLYLARKLTDNQETPKTIYHSLVQQLNVS